MGMEELRQGKELIKSSGETGGGKRTVSYTPYISWKQNETKSLEFITPIEEVPKVLMHNYVRKFYSDSKGQRKERWLTFMCRKDQAWRAESGNSCPLCDIGHKSTERFAALAVELEPKMNGKKLEGVSIKYNKSTDKEGQEVEYPAIGLVIQGPKFFGTLVSYDETRDISEFSWEITKEKSGLETRYTFFPVQMKPDLGSVLDGKPTLTDYLRSLGSMEYYDAEMGDISVADQPSFATAVVPQTMGSEKPTDLAFDVLRDALSPDRVAATPSVESY